MADTLSALMFKGYLACFLFSTYIQLTSCSYVCLKGSSTIGAAECTTVETCGPHEVCFSDAYSTTTGIRREYGCRDSQLCASNHVGRRRASTGGLLACSQCCQGDLCNSKLCGEKGFQLQGGPTCFACDLFPGPDTCNTIQHCGRDEICEILPDLSTVTHRSMYTSRCAKPKSCETQKNNVLMFSTGPVCGTKCCNTSLCNTDSCSQNSQTTVTNPVPTHSCPTGNHWIDFGNSCYFIGDRELSWSDSQSYCQQKGGFLARLDSQAKTDHINPILQSLKATVGIQAGSYWIGLNDIHTTGVWVWVDTNTPATYTNWYPGQVLNQNFPESCAVAAHYISWKWQIYGCNNTNVHQLCEIPKATGGHIVG
ncbi:uncharacterized protein LOC128239158 isoform X2 [Mya arenaria]|uniref:uncharacterized protein LOC128239158 isoform X2 n=1 Tax=Mya arenaria TaxID=6604 RepID=UPI0022DFD260|nr:uncharacterized protein LOC128239158 isoform X2 [Mya arenaria]